VRPSLSLCQAREPPADPVLLPQLADADGALLPSLISDTARLYAQHNGCTLLFRLLREPRLELTRPSPLSALADHDSDAQAVLEGVRYRRIDSAWLLVAFFRTLEGWLEERPKVSPLRLLLLLFSMHSFGPASPLDLCCLE